MIDDRAEGPVGGAAGIRPAGEVERVVHRPTTRGAQDERKPDACDGGRDSDGRARDRAVEARRVQPNEPGKHDGIGDDDRLGPAVLDPHGGVGARPQAGIAQAHVRGHADAQHR